MKHQFEECELVSDSFRDECDLCGELVACVCLASIVDEWEIQATGSAGAFAYRYQFTGKGELLARFGYAESYREAMDRIAHGAQCEKVGA